MKQVCIHSMYYIHAFNQYHLRHNIDYIVNCHSLLFTLCTSGALVFIKQNRSSTHFFRYGAKLPIYINPRENQTANFLQKRSAYHQICHQISDISGRHIRYQISDMPYLGVGYFRSAMRAIGCCG